MAVMRYAITQKADPKPVTPPSHHLPSQESRERRIVPASLRLQLFGLLSFLVMMLMLSGYLLQTTLDGNRHLVERQSDIIQALTRISSTNQKYGQLRWSYLTFLNQPNNYTKEKADHNLEALRQSIDSFEDIPVTDKIQKLYAHLDSLEAATMRIIENRTDPQQAETLTQQTMTDLGAVDTILSSLGNDLRQLLLESSNQTLEQTSALQKIPLLFILGGLLILAFVLAVVTYNIFVPVSRITKAMTAASLDAANAKNYTLDVGRDDEVGRATYALNHLLREVSSGIEKIRRTETQLRETGQYLQTILDNMLDGIIIVDTDGTVVSFSPGAEIILGYAQEKMIGQTIDTLFPAQEYNRDDILETIRTPDQEGRKHMPYEINIRHKNDSTVPVEMLISSAVYKNKLMNIVTVRDISIRKQMETLLNQAQRMETIGRMSGGIAHDFNNMLIVISGNLELIERRSSLFASGEGRF